MKKLLHSFLIATFVVVILVAVGVAAVNAVTPSTNDDNSTEGWAHVNEVSKDIGEVTLEFVSTRDFWSCFEYRSDGDTGQKTADNNFNTDIDDGLYPYYCINNSTRTETITANEYVEIRMVFGAETDERFDWTRFDVLPDAQTKQDCMNNGWATFGFRNQGLCIQFVNTGKDSR